MAWKIIWSAKAVITYNAIIKYLHEEWTEREANNFAVRVTEKLQIIEGQPRIGNAVASKVYTYRTLVHKKVSLFYRVRPLKKEIELVTFWNNLQNPQRLKLR